MPDQPHQGAEHEQGQKDFKKSHVNLGYPSKGTCMPRKVTINTENNPTGLTLGERQLAIEVIQSLRTAATRLRKEEANNFYWGTRRSGEMEDGIKREREMMDRVFRTALNQFAGRQKTEQGIFQLKIDANSDVQDKDLAYVMQSLGMPS